VKTKFTLQELRAVGLETIGSELLLGRGPLRRALPAGEDGCVVLDLGALAELKARGVLVERIASDKPPKTTLKSGKNAALGAPPDGAV
jgi:hypothetical protein